MSLQDDYFDLAASLKGEEKRKMNRIWRAMCAAERAAEEAAECVRLVNLARNLLNDKPPLAVRRRNHPG